MGMLEGAVVHTEEEDKALDQFGSGWVADLIREFKEDYADAPSITVPAENFGVTRKGNARTATNVAHQINKYADTHKLNVLASASGTGVRLKHFDRSVQDPPRHPQGRKPKNKQPAPDASPENTA